MSAGSSARSTAGIAHASPRFDTATGALTSWNPAGYDRTWGAVDAIAVTGDTVYLGGSFDRMGGAARVRLAAVDARTGRAHSRGERRSRRRRTRGRRRTGVGRGR
jgi:hypothetical protein